MTVPLKQDAHPPHDLNWIALWETDAAGELFAAVRAYCGLPPVVPEPLTAEMIEEELAEARQILEGLSETKPCNARFGVVTGDPAPCRTARHGAASTLEALMLSLRQRGIAALAEPDARRRLAELSEAQLHEAAGRLQRLKPQIARAWNADEIVRLVEEWVAS